MDTLEVVALVVVVVDVDVMVVAVVVAMVDDLVAVRQMHSLQ